MNKKPSIVALVPAAGEGRRLGFNLPKALVQVEGQTIIERTLHALCDGHSFEKILVMIPEGHETQFSKIDFMRAQVEFQIGGATRQESVFRGLQTLAPLPPDFVFIHDAARCFVTPELVSRCINAALEHGAVTAAIPSVDSLVRMQPNSKTLEYINRENLYAIQTPQVFKYSWLMEAHTNAPFTATDDASLVQQHHSITLVEGERCNIKITAPEDLRFL